MEYKKTSHILKLRNILGDAIREQQTKMKQSINYSEAQIKHLNDLKKAYDDTDTYFLYLNFKEHLPEHANAIETNIDPDNDYSDWPTKDDYLRGGFDRLVKNKINQYIISELRYWYENILKSKFDEDINENLQDIKDNNPPNRIAAMVSLYEWVNYQFKPKKALDALIYHKDEILKSEGHGWGGNKNKWFDDFAKKYHRYEFKGNTYRKDWDKNRNTLLKNN